MDLLKLLTYEEKIGGISIFDSRVEMLILEFKEKEGILSISTSSFVDLPVGVIAGGVLKNEEAFVAAISELIKKNKVSKKSKVSSFVVSIPANFIYFHSFSFPRNLSDQQIEEAMKLNLRFSLPLSQDAVYVDWETVQSQDTAKKEVVLCSAPKNYIDQYLTALSKAGVTTVALEFHALSISRVLALEPDSSAMIAIFSNNDLEIAIVESGALRFLQSFNIDKIIEAGEMNIEMDIVIDKLWRAMNFYDSEKGQKGSINKLYLTGDYGKIRDYKEIIGKKIEGLSVDFASILPIFPEMPLAKDSNLPQITFGASLRGLMPREEDAIISLMPIGTEEAYERKRMLSFAKIASDLVSVLSIFFIILFLGSWILMTVLLGNIEKSLQRQSSLPEGLIELKGQAVIFNETINQVEQLRQQTPKWSRFLERLGSFLAYGVTINRVDASIGGVTINGAALTRDSLLQFKTILEKTGLFSEVKIPFNYLEQKENISFSLILKFKDTEFIFK